MTIQQRSRFLLPSIVLGVIVSGTALAATDGAGGSDEFALKEVTVTATKTGRTKLQETPIAITAVTASDIAQTGISDIHGLMAETPNLNITQNGPYGEVYIRGIGSNNVFIGSDPDVSIYQDGVYIARPSSDFNNFLDVERVEVLRGPQGTLYGRNAVGGTINIISRKPDNTLQAKAEAGLGNYRKYDVQGYVSGPLAPDKLYASVSVLRETHNGYLRNIFPGGNDLDSQNTWATRAQIRATPSDRLDILVRGDYSSDSGAISTYQKLLLPYPADPIVNSTLGDYHHVALNTLNSADRRNYGVSGDVAYTVSDALKFQSITAYRRARLMWSVDTDGTTLSIRNSVFHENQNQFSEELNASGKTSGLTYVLGAYYFHENAYDNNEIKQLSLNYGVATAPLVHTNAWAAYGQATYNVTSRLSVTAGTRYTIEKKEFMQTYGLASLIGRGYIVGPTAYDLSNTYKASTPKLGLQFQASRDVMIYASATRGFKSGGYNATTGTALNGFNPEYLWSYETGIKSDWMHHRLRVNGDVFYYKYTDLQVQAFIVPGTVNITNAANAHVKGVEIELQAEPVEGLNLGGTLAYLEATYSSYPQAPVAGGATVNATGHYLDSAPKWAYSLYGQYRFPVMNHGSMFVRGEWSWRAKQYFTPDNSNIQSQDAYGLLNSSFGYDSPDGHWQAVVYGQNLTNRQYITSTGTFSVVTAGKVGDPRTYGVNVSYTY